MWNSVISAVSSAVSSAWDWFDSLFDNIQGAWPFVVVCIITYMICKHLLEPIIGGMAMPFSYGSDKVKSKVGPTYSKQAKITTSKKGKK